MSAHHFTEGTVAFASGHNLTLHNVEEKAQSFLTGASHGNKLPNCGIQAIDVFPSKKLVAIGERTFRKHPLVTVYENPGNEKRRKKKLMGNWPSQMQSKDIISLSFSGDGKYLLALGGAPDFMAMTRSVLKCRHEKYW